MLANGSILLRPDLRFVPWLALAIACNASSPPAIHPDTTSAPAAASKNVTPESASASLSLFDSGKRVTVAVGTTLIINLPTNAGTGYTWEATQGDRNILDPQDAPKADASVPPQAGGPSHKVFSFVAKAGGAAHLEIVLRRSWDNSPPRRTFTVDVMVR